MLERRPALAAAKMTFATGTAGDLDQLPTGARSAQRRGEPSCASLKWARSLVSEAIKLVL